MGYEVDNLITDLRDDVQASPNAEDSLNAQLLRSLNRERSLWFHALLDRVGGKHKQAYLDLTANGSATRFDVPVRAIAAGIVMVAVVDAAGRPRQQYEYTDVDRANGNPRPGTFFVEGNELVFHTAPVAGTLRVTYNRRLSKLVLLAEVGVITAISTTPAGQITISAAPSGFPTASTAYDFVRATPHFDLLAMNKSATRSGTTLTFSSADVPSRLVVGDHVCLAGESTVVQAPLELHRCLALRGAYMWARGKKDDVAETLKGDLKDAEADAKSLLKVRSKEEPLLVNPNGPGWYGPRGPRGTPSGVAP